MELKQMDSILLKMLYLIATGIVVTQVLALDIITSLLFILTFPLTVLLWLRSVRRTFTSSDGIMLITVMLTIISVLLNATVTGTSLSFEYLKKAIMFTMTLLFLQTANRMRVGQDMERFIGRMASFLALFFVAAYFLLGSRAYILNDRVTVYLTFNFTNPNMTGMFLMCIYMLIMHSMVTFEKWYVKLLHIVLALFMAWFVWLSQSRNCLLVMAIYTVIYVWLLFRSPRRKMRVGRVWAVLVAVFPAIFVWIYMFFVSNLWVNQLLGFLVGEGKGLDSRVKIWKPALAALRESPLIGAYSQLSGGTGSFHMHNTHLDLACSYGVLVLVLTCVLLYRYFHQSGREYRDKGHYCYMLGFICAVLLGIGETALFSGGLGIYVFIGSLLLLANGQKTEDR